MNTNPQVAGSILRVFTIAAVVGVSGVFAADQIISIATRKQMAEGGRAELSVYNAEARPAQDRLDTIFDRTKLLNRAKEAKPWNKTLAELDRTKR